MQIKRDLVATIQGPGWSYGMCRVLITTTGEAAVFIPPGEAPAQTFTVTADTLQGGTGTTADGGTVKFRRRGASCSYRLAKCNTPTATLAGRWDSWLVS